MVSQHGLCYAVEGLCAQRVSGGMLGRYECPKKAGVLVVLCPSGSRWGGHWPLLVLQVYLLNGGNDNVPSALCLSHLGLSEHTPSCVYGYLLRVSLLNKYP